MRIHLAWGIMIVCAGTIAAAQTSTPSKKESAKPVTLAGCVSRDKAATNQFTLADDSGNVIYRLTGMDVRSYFGQRVQIVGGVPETRKLKIVGGLIPNANAAAQAGSIDPVQAAQESAGGSAGPGTVELPEFKVKSVRPVSGNCSG